ncbi:uncharacterized protein MEPE_04012 [Melanopsichium pennsylvanicum]|uniref:DUF4536 domain-containing protein n=1 Tax=Melanopsichium pennsylvanicum TaxID=63383 RepID=A0AAJ5C682_9BASI|nr:uncharacterized protein MEPE_04012 [Melanopsichium pennsylvanicum]
MQSQFRIHSVLESSPAAPANRLPGSDCLACRLTGFAAMSGLSAYSFAEAYRMGTFRHSPLPVGVKARPLWVQRSTVEQAQGVIRNGKITTMVGVDLIKFMWDVVMMLSLEHELEGMSRRVVPTNTWLVNTSTAVAPTYHIDLVCYHVSLSSRSSRLPTLIKRLARC